MSTSLPSLMSRKKKIAGTRTFNSAKVFADYVPSISAKKSLYNETFHPKNIIDMPIAGKTSKPDLKSVSFLHENPRFLNEPICLAQTRNTWRKQSKWWPDSPVTEHKVIVHYKEDTINRSDYKPFEKIQQGLTRYECTPKKSKFAKGIVPTLDTDTFIAKEKVSFEHQFDCRQGRKERGKLHGSFVWEPVVNEQMKERIKLRLRQQKSNIFG